MPALIKYRILEELMSCSGIHGHHNALSRICNALCSKLFSSGIGDN